MKFLTIRNSPTPLPDDTYEDQVFHVNLLQQADRYYYSVISEAACDNREAEPLFYSNKEKLRLKAAELYCATCPVFNECLLYSLIVREPDGVWGGLLESTRSEILSAAASSLGRSVDSMWTESYWTAVLSGTREVLDSPTLEKKGKRIKINPVYGAV